MFVSNKIPEVVELGSGFFEDFDLYGFIVFVSEEFSDFLHSIVEQPDDVIDFALILGVLAEEVGLAGAVDDVFGNGGGLCEFEVTFDEVGQVGEIEGKIVFVFLEPLVLVVVLDLREIQS